MIRTKINAMEPSEKVSFADCCENEFELPARTMTNQTVSIDHGSKLI